MDNKVIFITKISSTIGFIVALFILYRLLVKNKDSTIELLNEKINLLEFKLEQSKEQSPDVLVESITKRTKLLTDELELLNKDFVPKYSSDLTLKKGYLLVVQFEITTALRR